MRMAEFKDKVTRLKNEIIGSMPDMLEDDVNNILIPAIVERIRSSGKKSGDGNFSSYKDYWANVRAKNGRQTGFKDFTFLGNLLDSLKVNGNVLSDGRGRFRVSYDFLGKVKDGDGRAPRKDGDRDARWVASGHSEREGTVISQMTEQEKKDLYDRIYKWLESKVITL